MSSLRFTTTTACLLAAFLFLPHPDGSLAQELPALAGPDEIAAAEFGITDFYYDPLSGGVHVSVGENVIVLGIEGAPLFLENRNNDSALGPFEQADSGGLGQLSFNSSGFDLAGLPTGIHNLGNVLEPGINTPSEFSTLYGDFNFKSGSPGVPTHFSGVRVFGSSGIATVGGFSTEPPVVEPPDPPEPPVVTPPPLPEPPSVPLPDVAEAQPRDADLYYDPHTGGLFVSVGESVIVIGLQGADFNLENRNEFSALGIFEQADAGGLGQLSFAGLQTGVHNLGTVLDPGFFTADAFSAEYEDFVFRIGPPGVPEIREGVQILGTSETTVPPNPTPPVVNPPDPPPVDPVDPPVDPVDPPVDPVDPPVDPVDPPVDPVDPPVDPVDPPTLLPPMFANEIGEAAPGEAEAYYDPATGEIFVSIGEGVLVLGLEGAPLILDNRNSDSELGAFEQADAGGLGQLSFSGLPTGVFSLGNLLPPGANSPEEFTALYDNFIFRSGAAGVSEIRSGIQILDRRTLAIPEPGCLVLLSLAGIAMVTKRRR